MKLGVAVKTRNRRAVFNRTISQWRRRMPEDSVLVVVDDASDEPVPEIDGVTVIRHEHRLGVAMAANTGIAALMDANCTDHFYVDDDLCPIVNWWYRPYVDSPEPHLSYQGPRAHSSAHVDGDDRHYAVEFPRGFMLYMTREVIDTVGGMDPACGAWGGEHAVWQQRIHRAELTTWPYADVRGSDNIWHSLITASSVNYQQRKRMLARNDIQWQKVSTFMPYRQDHCEQDWQLGPEIRPDGQTWPVLRHVLDLEPTGTAVEFGTGEGNTTRIIADRMPVVSFGSKDGLPEDWRPHYPKGRFAYDPPQIDNATIVEGLFDNTLPTFDFESLGYIGLVHFDADLYSSTQTALKHIGPHLRVGSYLIFDEWTGYEGCEDHEQRAFREWAGQSKVGWTVVGHYDKHWAIRITGIPNA